MVFLAATLASNARADLRREVEPNGSTTSAQPVAPPGSIGGVIGAPGDVDVFAVALEAGQKVTADVLARGFRAGNSPGSDLSALLQIRDTDGTTVLAQDQSNGDYDDPTVSFQVAAAGRYFVWVQDLSAAEGGSGHVYVLSLEVDPNDTTDTATPIVPPVLPSIDALIYPAGDVDYYRLTGAAGQVLTVDIDAAAFNPVNPAAKIVVTILDASLAILASDSYNAADPEDPFVQLTLPSNGDYFIQIRELRQFIGTTNTFYQMSVELGPATTNDTYANGMPIQIPRAVSGVVGTSSDVDHFRFTLSSPETVELDLDARQGLLSLLTGSLGLHDSGGLIASDSSSPDPSIQQSAGAGDLSASVSGPCSGQGCLNEDSYYVLFIDADADGDGIVLPTDNCPSHDNVDQADGDHDGAGDSCDNCPFLFNPDQRDDDADGVGNACEGCAPPGEGGMGLRFDTATDLSWTGSTPSYNLYRGTLAAGGWVFDHTCLEPGLDAPAATDGEIPTGVGFYYLVSPVDACGEGNLGTSTGDVDTPRPNVSPCQP